MKIFLVTPYKIDIDFEKKKTIIRSLFSKHGIELLLAENKDTKESLSAQETLELFNQSDYYIVDLSYERPSCYYELGYLQALGKDLLVIARVNEPIHQLLNRESIQFFKNLKEYEILIEKFVLTIKN